MTQTNSKRKRPSLTGRLLLILLICLADIIWASRLIYSWKEAGTMISARDGAAALPTAVSQQLILAAVPILLFVIGLAVFRDRFAQELALVVSGKKQRTIVLILTGALLCEAAAALVVKKDAGGVLYGLLYYTAFIAFTEEFVVRGFCVRLLKGENAWLRYLWPNCLFAAMHFFAYADWNEITADYALRFFTGSFLGLMAAGCVFQLLKEKTGTLWVPVLIHAALDFGNVFSW